MTSKTLRDYIQFVRNMWLDNCEERDAFNDPHLSLHEYEQNNITFLEDCFYMKEYGGKVWNYEVGAYV